jgi:subtilisin family serine protease
MEKAKDITKPGFFDSLAGLEHVVDIRIPSRPEPDSAQPMSEGVGLTAAAEWHDAGITGKGVKVGVLDAGFEGYQSLLGTGLPERVTVKAFTSNGEIAPEGASHGTACAEIVHEMAPEAEMYLAAWETEADWFNAVDWLVSQGVRVISQSMGDFSAPFDGTGNRAQKIDELRAKGILWVNSNGNYAQEHYAAKLNPDVEGWHQFAPGKTRMKVAPYGNGSFYLNWRDWQNRTVDYDLYIFNSQDEIVASSRNVQGGGKAPVEWVYLRSAKGETYYVGIKAKDPSRMLPFDFYLIHGDIEFPVPQNSINTYSSAKGAFAVGAINARTGKLEPYSSWGPTWDGRPKPDISAPTVVSTLVPDYSQNGFNGTSAATPHVAGAAALVLSANPSLTPDKVIQFLEEHAIDLGTVGVTVRDCRVGYGLLYLGEP